MFPAVVNVLLKTAGAWKTEEAYTVRLLPGNPIIVSPFTLRPPEISALF